MKNTEIKEVKPVENEKNNEETKTEEKKPGRVKRFFGKVGNGIKQAWESPVATAIGAVIGAAVTVGVSTLLNHKSGHSEEIPVGELLPEPEDDYTTTDDVVNE